MTTQELREELERIIKKYLVEEDISLDLIAKISNDNVKGILAEVDMYKTRTYDKQDIEKIKDIYFYFC